MRQAVGSSVQGICTPVAVWNIFHTAAKKTSNEPAMSTAPPRQQTARRSDIDRALKAAQKAGLTVTSLEISPDGTVRVHTGETAKPAEPAAELTDWDIHFREIRAREAVLFDPLRDCVVHDPAIDAALAKAAATLDLAKLDPAWSGNRVLEASALAELLGMSPAQIKRAAENGQLERRQSPILCFTRPGVLRSLEGARVRARKANR